MTNKFLVLIAAIYSPVYVWLVTILQVAEESS